MVEAARRLFLESGYPATTMAQIAEESGVPPATVYRLFGSKRGILKAVLDVAFGGDDEAIEFQHRPEVQDAFAAGTLERCWMPSRTCSAVSCTEPARCSTSWRPRRSSTTRRLRCWRSPAGNATRDRAASCATSPAARRCGPESPRAAAADIVYTVMSPEVYRILTVERGWSEDEYEAWLARTLRTQLLDTHASE